MKRASILFLLTVLALSFLLPKLLAQSSTAIASDLDKPIAECEQQVASWQHQATLQMISIVAIMVFGGVVSGLHRSKTQSAKVMTAVLGVAVSVLTAVNSRLFDADYKTLRQSAAEGKNVIGELEAIESNVKDATDEQDRVSARGEYLKKLLEFREISQRLNGTAQTSAVRNLDQQWFSLTPVYASASSLPPWVQKPPSDNVSRYFVGKGEDASLPSAKAKSQNDAYGQASQAFSSNSVQASSPDLLALIKASSIVEDSAFSYDRGKRIYTYYTLLRVGKEIESLGLKALPVSGILSPVTFKKNGWRPADLTAGPNARIFALDDAGTVSQLTTDQNEGRIDGLFRLKGAYSGVAVSATSDSVFVATNSQVGCSLFKYSLSTKATTSRRVGGTQELCGGIATDGTVLYVTLSKQNSIRAFKNWDDQSPQNWTLDESNEPGPIVFDQMGHRLVVGDHYGHAFGISTANHARQLLASDLGYISSVAVSERHILIASGHKILFLSRSDNQGENPPSNVQLTGGHIVGVAVDTNGNLWFADYENQLVEGPIPLS